LIYPALINTNHFSLLTEKQPSLFALLPSIILVKHHNDVKSYKEFLILINYPALIYADHIGICTEKQPIFFALSS
jgi:hypothetical protein